MSRGGKGGKRKYHFKDMPLKDPQVRRFWDWLTENRGFYANFRQWLTSTGFSDSALNIYGVAARQAIGYLDKPYWVIDPDTDIEQVWQHLQSRPLSQATKADYHKGLLKLAEYLRLRCHHPPKPKTLHWDYYLGPLSGEFASGVRQFTEHLRRAWPPEHQHERTLDLVSPLTRTLRWMAGQAPLERIEDLTPNRWFEYLDERLAQGIKPTTLNGELSSLRRFLSFLSEQGQAVCERMLRVPPLERGDRLPRDVPPEQLAHLQNAIRLETTSSHLGLQRLGKLDLAWFLLMLHSGLRTGEVRALRLGSIDWERQRVRIEQSKGLKDRMVFLSGASVAAIQAYLEVRGPAEALPDQLFIYRHKPLTRSYCGERLDTYGERCGIRITPHQLRHSCATLLLNSGAPVLSVQMLLGHKHVDTTLGYARLYDGTVAADYYQAMTVVEKRLGLPEDRLTPPPSIGQLLAMVDALRQGVLNAAQIDLVRQLRNGLMALAEQRNRMEDVKVPSQID